MKDRMIILLVVVAGFFIVMVGVIKLGWRLAPIMPAYEKRSMADMRSIATAWEMRAVEVNTYAPPSAAPPVSVVATANNAATFRWPSENVSYETLRKMLSPTYMKNVPRKDGWGHDYQFAVTRSSSPNDSGRYAIRSPGRDGRFEGTIYKKNNAVQSFDADVVFANGSFVQWHEGAMR